MSGLRRVALAVAALLFVAVVAFVGERVAERGRFTGSYSSYGAGPRGTRGLYLLAERLGMAPLRWSQDLAALPERGVLVALGACDTGMARPLSRYESKELADWVERGGVLFVGGARNFIPEALGVSFEAEPGCKSTPSIGAFDDPSANEDPDEDVTPPIEVPLPDSGEASETSETGDAGEAADAGMALGIVGGLPGAGAAVGTVANAEWAWAIASDDALDGVETIPMHRPGHLLLEPDADARVLMMFSSAGRTAVPMIVRDAAVIVRHGRGHVIALASASMLQNQMLATSGGGVLFARLMRAYGGRGPVLFDEYHLGVGERRSLMRYLRQMGAFPYLGQLMLVALIALWRGGARFGGVREPERTPAASTASFVAALGGLFARAGDASSALRILAKQALARIAAYHHLPHVAPDRLSAALAETGRGDAAEAVQRIAALEQQDARAPGKLAVISRALDEQVARACRR
jgi:hypothetical protein